MNLAIKCSVIKETSEAIKVNLNNQTILDQNPNCRSYYDTINVNLPLDSLNSDGRNQIVLQTNGLYKIAMSVNKIYLNNKDTYKFTLNSFNDLIDVIMYGDFDKDVIDLRVNSQTISLKRNEIKSILQYLRYGTNEIDILTKPVEIKKLIVEKNQYYN